MSNRAVDTPGIDWEIKMEKPSSGYAAYERASPQAQSDLRASDASQHAPGRCPAQGAVCCRTKRPRLRRALQRKRRAPHRVQFSHEYVVCHELILLMESGQNCVVHNASTEATTL